MSESTNIQGLSTSFENSNNSYPFHTTCVVHLSPSSLCYPWSPSYHLSNHVTVQRTFTSRMLYHHPSSHMLLVHSFHVSKPSQHTLINSTRRLSFHFSSSYHLFIPLLMQIRIIHTYNFSKVNKVKFTMARSPQWRIYYHSSQRQLSTTCSNATEVAQLAATNSRPQPATNNGVRHGRST